MLLGASGAGKSSLLRAGVLPRLRHSGQLRRLRWPHWQGPAIATDQRVIHSIVPLSNDRWLTAGREDSVGRS